MSQVLESGQDHRSRVGAYRQLGILASNDGTKVDARELEMCLQCADKTQKLWQHIGSMDMQSAHDLIKELTELHAITWPTARQKRLLGKDVENKMKNADRSTVGDEYVDMFNPWAEKKPVVPLAPRLADCTLEVGAKLGLARFLIFKTSVCSLLSKGLPAMPTLAVFLSSFTDAFTAVGIVCDLPG